MFKTRSPLDILWDFVRKPKNVPVVQGPKITRAEMEEILASFNAQLWLSDNTFMLMDTNSLRTFLNVNPVDKRKYITEFSDCDDRCYELMGDVSTWHPAGAFGMVWGNRATDGAGHAWNFFIDEFKKVRYVEPQEDRIFEPSTEKIWVMII